MLCRPSEEEYSVITDSVATGIVIDVSFLFSVTMSALSTYKIYV